MNETPHTHLTQTTATQEAAPDALSAESLSSPQTPRNVSWAWRLMNGLPTVIVLLGLVAAVWVGSRLEWKLPKFSEWIGPAPAAEEAWCDEHGVPEAICIACNAALMPKGELYGWCQVHGVHECLLEHPNLAELREQVEVTEADLERAARALACRPRPSNDSSCQLHLRRIQFESMAAVDRAGIDIALAESGEIRETLTAAGEIVFDPTQVSHLTTRTEGSIWRVEKKIGDPVAPGDVLALVDSAEVGKAKADLLQAFVELELNQKTLARLAGLEGAIAGHRIIEAETELAKSRVAVIQFRQKLGSLGLPSHELEAASQSTEQLTAELQFLGIPPKVRQTIDPSFANANLVPIVANREGVVIASHATPGEVADRQDVLFTVADTRQMWVLLHLQLEDAPYVQLGQELEFLSDGASRPRSGRVTWISPEVNAETRTVTVRGELDNSDGQLRNETFGTGEIVLRREPQAVLVPDEAVHWEGCCFIAFVRDRNYFDENAYKVFHTRSVRPGIRQDGKTEIIAGLLPGEVVVTRGSGVLRAELLKGNLGAG